MKILKTLNGKILVKMLEEKQTKSGILLAQQEDKGVAEVVMTPHQYQVVHKGDKVLIDKFVGVNYDGFKLVDEEDLYAILGDD